MTDEPIYIEEPRGFEWLLEDPTEVAGDGAVPTLYRVVCMMFVGASLIHLYLPDAWQLEWLVADLIYLAGLGLLVWRGALAGWLLSAAGLLLPLLFHRDQLTQSVIMLSWAVAAILGVGWDLWRRATTEEEGGEVPPDGLSGFLSAVRVVTILAYLTAAMHKLNVDFIDPQYSCAVYGFDEVATYWSAGWIEWPGWFASAAPFIILGLEASIGLLLAFGVRRVAWSIAAVFHLPLTLVMAPAFGFVMAAGHSAFATREDGTRLKKVACAHGPWLVGTGIFLTTVSAWLHGAWPGLAMFIKEAAIWTAILGLPIAFPPWRRSTWRSSWRGSVRASWQSAKIRVALPAAIGLMFFANGLTPYFGLQYQHTAAMVSNLRIDRGCWNSLIFPESMRGEDPYIRVEDAYFGEPGRIPYYEEVVLTQLWNPTQIRQMRRNWCTEEIRPFYMRGTYLGESFEIEDVCAGEPLPFGEFRLFGEPVFGDFLRFQKNLERECPQTCIH